MSEDTVSLVSSVTSDSYNPSAPLMNGSQSPVGRGLMRTSYLGLNIILIVSERDKHRTSVTFHD